MSRAARVRALVARWRAELAALGPAPRLRSGRSVIDYQRRARPWHERQAAIAGAVQFAREIDQEEQHAARSADPLAEGQTALEQRVAELRGAGLTFRAIAGELAIPVGSAKTIARRLRMQAAKEVA